jgi:hypothetical protein
MTHSGLTGGPQVEPGMPPPNSRQVIDFGVARVDGQRHLFYDAGQSLLMVPGDGIGTSEADLDWQSG